MENCVAKKESTNQAATVTKLDSEVIKKLNIVLIKPSKYDDDGYVIRHFRGVLPSNTLACLYALTDDVRKRKVLGDDIEIVTEMLDETVHRINVKKIAKSGRKSGAKTIVGLVGVQTNQFPRASDLCLQFRDEGTDVILGGFHVGGLLALFDEIPEDIQLLMDRGVSIVAGEVEDHWGRILRDSVEGRLKPLYNLLDEPPDMRSQPVPVVNKKYLRRFAFPNFGTVDCGRGCPFNCSFCTIINVHGRKVRCRNPEIIAEALRQNYKAGISFYFFTDDNFTRNKNWESIFDMLIHLREEENIRVDFMMQVDVLSHKIDSFITKAKRAGCTNVFIGMESMNPKNLTDAGKTQNVVGEYADLVSAWHRAGISTHVGFIIGFPADTRESIREDVQTLIHKIKVELVSFFMLTPLPGSMDHRRMVNEGAYMDPDYNRYDSFHETQHHQIMKDGEWNEVYLEAWNEFYKFDNMKAILNQSNKHRRYWDLLWKFLWYKGSTTIENTHPMVSGFFRLKDRRIRRPGFEEKRLLAHLRMRTSDVVSEVLGWIKILWEIQELWLQTRPQTWFEIKLVREWKHLRESVTDCLTVFEWKTSRSRFWTSASHVLRKINVFSLGGIHSRQDLNQFWGQFRQYIASGRFYRIRPIKTITNSFRDLKITLHFLRSLASGFTCRELAFHRKPRGRPGSDRPAIIALGLPQKFEGLKRSIETFLRELGIDIVSYDGAFTDLGVIDIGVDDQGGNIGGTVRSYLESLKGKADFVLLPFAEELERFHENFVSGISEMTSDVKGKLTALPRVIHFPVIETETHTLKDSLVRLGLFFTDDVPTVIAASEKAAQSA
jgi:radical SAM superfamily enzyme YgiQ (UPF0313 family)